MNLLLIVLKASCIMGAAAIVSALRHRRSSASFRHLVWTLAVAGLLALPVLSVGLPGWRVAMPAALAPNAAIVVPPDTLEIADSPAATAGAAEATAKPTVGRQASLAAILPGIYLAGVLLLLLRLVHERWQVHRLARRAVDVEDAEWTQLLSECADADGRPASCPPVAQSRAQHADGLRHTHTLDPDSRPGRHVDRGPAPRRSSP